MERRATHHLHVEVALAEDPFGRLAGDRERLEHDLVELFAVVESLAEDIGLGLQLGVAHRLVRRLELVDVGDEALERPEALPFTGAEDAIEDSHAVRECIGAPGASPAAGYAGPVGSERDQRWRGRTGSGRRLLRTAALGLLCGAGAGAPAGETERAADFPEPSGSATTASTTTTTAPPVTFGSLRASIRGTDDLASPAEPRPSEGPPSSEEPPPQDDPPEDVVLVGDSVLVLVADDIARRLPSTLHVDAADCRRIDMQVSGPCGGVPSGAVVDDGITAIAETVSETRRRGIEPEAAVIILGNNSDLDAGVLDEAMTALAGIPKVWWVTTRIEGFGRQDPNNALLTALAERDERAGVIDWYGHSTGQDWLADHVHPNPTGEQALSALIARHLRCDCTP